VGALRLAEADRPSLVLVDIVLRGEMDGIEAAARIHERTGAPVLFVTALGDQATRERAMATGASGFLVKPFLGRELDAAIRGALQHPDPGLRRRQPSASPPSTPSVVPRSHEALRVLAEELRRHNDELTRDRRRAEERSEHYRSLYELAPDAYLVTDAMTVIQEANQAAGLLLGVEPERLSGKPLSLFIAHDEHHTYDQQLDHLRRDPRRRQWQTVLCPRGRHPFHGSLAILPV